MTDQIQTIDDLSIGSLFRTGVNGNGMGTQQIRRCVMKIYVASSWRNERQPGVVAALRAAGHDVYDFKNPRPGDHGFSWKQILDKKPQDWTPREYRDEVLVHTRAREGFDLDMGALRACDACVLVLPCGRSAHLELGWAAGANKQTIVLLDERIDEPELMYLMNTSIALDVDEVIGLLAEPTYVPCERAEATHVLVTKDSDLEHVGRVYPIRKRDLNDVIVDLGGGVRRVIYEGEHEWRRAADSISPRCGVAHGCAQRHGDEQPAGEAARAPTRETRAGDAWVPLLRENTMTENEKTAPIDTDPEAEPYVCPGCYAVDGPCAPGCIDDEMRRDRDRFVSDVDEENDD